MALEGIDVHGEVTPEFAQVLTPEALGLVADLQRAFNGRRLELLRRREERQAEIDAGVMPDFLAETAEIRAADWTVAPIPHDLLDRRVEITGPVDRKMVINALNSGANVFMADFEDAHSPTWTATIEGQINLRDAVDRTIAFTSPEGKQYRLSEQTAVLLVRPRGWHLSEKHVLIDGEPMSASLFELRSLGLHLQRHSQVPEAPGVLSAGSRAGDHDHSLHAGLLATGHQDLPPAERPRDGGHGGPDTDQE
jgi:malate synthase